MTELMWAENLPDEYRQGVEPILKRYLWLVPHWCRTLRVQNFTRSEGGETASMDTNVEYRWARLDLTPLFLEQSPEVRTRGIVHELLHISLTAAADVFANIMATTEDGPFKTLAEEEWRKASEAGVQDLAYAIAGREEPGESDL